VDLAIVLVPIVLALKYKSEGKSKLNILRWVALGLFIISGNNLASFISLVLLIVLLVKPTMVLPKIKDSYVKIIGFVPAAVLALNTFILNK